MNAARHHVGDLIGVVLVSDFMDLNRVVIKQIDEAGQLLYDNHLGALPFPSQGVRSLIIALGDDREQHLEDLVGVLLPLEEGEEHFSEDIGQHEASLIFNHLVELLAQIVQDPIVEVVSVHQLDYVDPILVLAICGIGAAAQIRLLSTLGFVLTHGRTSKLSFFN